LRKCVLDRRIVRHPTRDMGQHAGLDNHPTIDELLRIGIEQARVKPEMFGHPLHVDTSDRQPHAGLGFDDAQDLKRLGHLANAESTDPERLRELPLCRQPITRSELVLDDVLFDLLRDLITHLGATNRLHVSSCMACGTQRHRVDYLTI
jgi:hypothetical protein